MCWHVLRVLYNARVVEHGCIITDSELVWYRTALENECVSMMCVACSFSPHDCAHLPPHENSPWIPHDWRDAPGLPLKFVDLWRNKRDRRRRDNVVLLIVLPAAYPLYSTLRRSIRDSDKKTLGGKCIQQDPKLREGNTEMHNAHSHLTCALGVVYSMIP